MRGDITEVEPLQKLTLADAFAIAQTAYEKDDMFYAIEWLKYIIEEVKTHRISDIDDKVSSSAIFHMLSNAYFRVSNDEINILRHLWLILSIPGIFEKSMV